MESNPGEARAVKPLGERLVEAGHITEQQLELALKEQKRTGEMLGEVLQSLGFITSEIMARTLASQSGSAHIDISSYLVDPELLNIVPESFARKARLIPIDRDKTSITIVMANVFDVIAIDELEKITGLFVKTVSAIEEDILKAIDNLYGREISIDDIIEQCIELASKHGVSRLDTNEAVEGPIIRLVDQLIIKGIKDNATDIHIEPEEKLLRTRYRIDGILRQGTSLPKELQLAIIARLKIMAEANIAETRIPQDGKINFQLGKKNVDIRFSTFPTNHGENVVLRLLDKSRIIIGLDQLGLSSVNFEILKKSLSRQTGIILVTGPTGSGKTTTLYSALHYLNSMEKNIITIEDPIEYVLPMIRQSQVNNKAGFTFASGLRAILRQDPDIILVGETRDFETAELAIRASLTGHLVLTTLHSNDALGAMPRLIDMGIEPFLLASTVIAAIAQRLIRIVCNKCKEEYIPSTDELRMTGIDNGKSHSFYKGKGCRDCNFTGYKGRSAVFEIFPVSTKMKRLIEENSDGSKLREAAIEEGMKTLFMDALSRAINGDTTLEEVIRVTYGETEIGEKIAPPVILKQKIEPKVHENFVESELQILK